MKERWRDAVTELDRAARLDRFTMVMLQRRAPQLWQAIEQCRALLGAKNAG